MKKIKCAGKIAAKHSVKGRTYYLKYNIDNKFINQISIIFPFSLENMPKSLLNLLGLGVTTMLAEMSLAKKIEMDIFASKKQIKVLNKLIKILYDIRRYSETGKIRAEYPEIKCITKRNYRILNKNNKKCVLLWSGGVDSTYSFHLLRKNRYVINALHLNINQDFENQEQAAIIKLAKHNKTNLDFAKTEFKELKQIGRQYSSKFSRYPDYNAIPFGRELISIFVALIFSYQKGCSNICVGHEYELWKNKIKQKGKPVYRNALQSEQANILLQKLIQTVSRNTKLFSPIAGLSKYKIYKDMINKYPEELKYTTSCYFGNKCDKCVNCILYNSLNAHFKGRKVSPCSKELNVGVMTPKETFSKLISYIDYEEVQKIKNKKKFKEIIKARLGEDINLSKQDLYHQLNTIKKVKLLPARFKIK